MFSKTPITLAASCPLHYSPYFFALRMLTESTPLFTVFFCTTHAYRKHTSIYAVWRCVSSRTCSLGCRSSRQRVDETLTPTSFQWQHRNKYLYWYVSELLLKERELMQLPWQIKCWPVLKGPKEPLYRIISIWPLPVTTARRPRKNRMNYCSTWWSPSSR